MSTTSPTQHDRYLATRRVTLVGAGINLVLSALQITFGWLAGSAALLADGIHTLSDLISDGMVLIAARIGAMDADEDHPYGHGRFETLATVGLGAALIMVAGGLIYGAGERLLEAETIPVPATIALAVAALGIVAKEGLYHYTKHVAQRIRSRMLEANAWHHRSDAVSSLIVFAGIGGALLGYPWLDAVAAILVGFMIAKMGWELARSSVMELVDTAPDPEKVQAIRDLIEAIPGVEDLHVLRVRSIGADMLVDVHIQVAPRLTVSEGHFISEQVRQGVVNDFEDVADVLVHIDPEDDETETPSAGLPSREAILADLHAHCETLSVLDCSRAVRLHYIGGHIDVDVVLPLDILGSLEQARMVEARLNALSHSREGLGEIHVEVSLHNNSATKHQNAP